MSSSEYIRPDQASFAVHTGAFYFRNLEQARLVGQMIDHIATESNGVLAGTQRFVYLQEIGGGRPALYPAQVDRSKITRGQQEVSARLGSLVKNLRSAIPELAEVDFLEEVMVLENRDWTIDYQRLFSNIAEHVDRAATLPVFKDAVALTLQNEALRGVK